MTRSKKKKQQGNKKSSRRSARRDAQERLRTVLAEANARVDPLAALPTAFLSAPLPPARDGDGDGGAVVVASNGQNGNSASGNHFATVRHFSSPLPPAILEQCLELFQRNMGEMYQQSSWGLDLEEKLKELKHPDARFLVALSSGGTRVETTTSTTSTATAAVAAEAKSEGTAVQAEHPNDDATTDEKGTVLAFAHFRYEADDDSRLPLPVTYLYELQVDPSCQKLGLGKRLMTIVELISLGSRMRKCMLTVFHANVGAMKFYERNGYVVDECSPSNFEGEGCESCDYEILSKSFG